MKEELRVKKIKDGTVIDHIKAGRGKKVLDILKKQGTKYISFTGGEPLFVERIDDLIIYAKKLGFFVKLCTHGA